MTLRSPAFSVVFCVIETTSSRPALRLRRVLVRTPGVSSGVQARCPITDDDRNAASRAGLRQQVEHHSRGSGGSRGHGDVLRDELRSADRPREPQWLHHGERPLRGVVLHPPAVVRLAGVLVAEAAVPIEPLPRGRRRRARTGGRLSPGRRSDPRRSSKDHVSFRCTAPSGCVVCRVRQRGPG